MARGAGICLTRNVHEMAQQPLSGQQQHADLEMASVDPLRKREDSKFSSASMIFLGRLKAAPP